MSINKHDDYEKLAKILYPSIEASGNVYYGQTRKLTMDEILGKNNVNFESHIETITTEESSDSYRDVIRKSYFCWKLGPLHGSYLCSTVTERFNGATSADITKDKLLNDDFGFNGQFLFNEDCHTIEFDGNESEGVSYSRTYYGTLFAKYKLNLNQITVENVINSGVYNSYENSVSCEFCYPVLTNNTDPSKPLAYNIYNISDRSFYIKYENDEIYLYVQIATANMYDGESANKPLTIVSCEDNNTIYFEIDSTNTVGQEYEASENGDDTWEDLTNWQTELNRGDYVSIRRKDNGDPAWCRLSMWSDKEIKAYNNANSVLAKDFINLDDLTVVNNGSTVNPALVENGLFGNLFQTNIHLTKMPILPSSVLPAYAYSNLFKDCKWLDVSILPAITLSDGSYQYMFMNVNYLTSGPKLPATACSVNSYMNMFYNYGVSFVGVQSNIKVNGDGEDIATSNWLGRDEDEQVGGGILICQSNAPLEPNSTSGIPTGWQKIAYDPDKDDDYENIVISVPHNGYNVRQHLVECNSDNSQCYKPYDYIVASGSDSNHNGRGYIVSNTEFNMANRDKINAINHDTYNYMDGSYNQEIWGYKWFNSPAIFRNGIYGERSYITTYMTEIETHDDDLDISILDTLKGSKWKTNYDNDYAYVRLSDYERKIGDSENKILGSKAEVLAHINHKTNESGGLTITSQYDGLYDGVDYTIVSVGAAYVNDTLKTTRTSISSQSELRIVSGQGQFCGVIEISADEIKLNGQITDGITVNGVADLNNGATVGGNIVPDSHDSHSLGEPDKYFNHAYAMTVQCGECDARDIILTGELSGGENATIGSPGTYFPEAYVEAIHAGEIDEGVLPHPTISGGVLSVPIGAMVLVLLPVGSISTLDYAGLQFTVPTDVATVYTAIFNSGTGKAVSGSHTLPAGTYIGIGGGAETSGGDGWALVMRIAN